MPHLAPSPTVPSLQDDEARRAAWELDEGLSAPSTFVALGLCQLNQWALDFDGNLERVMESIRQVRQLGGYFRMGPELEISGYSCDDHFHETDTTAHCWQSILKILRTDLSHNCLLDIGMPVEHNSVRYNSRLYILNGRILLIRPKMFLANDGAYRETRHFGAWKMSAGLEDYILPKSVQRLYNQKTCPIGFAALQCNDCTVAAESCEELFTPNSPHLALCLGGVDVFANGSASYFEIGKLQRRMDLIMAPTQKMGGIYLYCNCKGNDGGKTFFDGSSFIACNGELVNMLTSFSCNDVEVTVEHINVNRVRSFRACNPSFAVQSTGKPVPMIQADIWLSGCDDSSIRVLQMKADHRAPLTLPSLPEELGKGVACWLWDYLRRSKAQGFFVPLSGGADSAAVSAIVRLMCESVMKEINAGTPGVLNSLERVLRMTKNHPAFPGTAAEMCFQILHTAYLGTKLSSAETKTRARHVAEDLNSYHLDVVIDDIVNSTLSVAASCVGGMPRFMARGEGRGGSKAEDLACQNIQARTRTILSYLLAGLLPSKRASDRLAKPPAQMDPQAAQHDMPDLTEEQQRLVGPILVLGTGNIDEVIRGYFTKYDCSSGDLAPIGSISKLNLKLFLEWASVRFDAKSLTKVLEAVPTAELRPDQFDKDGKVLKQSDEDEMGLTYNELYFLGNLRKCERCGPVEMYERLVEMWKTQRASVKRHDGTALTPTNRPSQTPQISSSDELEGNVMQAVFEGSVELSPARIATKVKHFFRTYAANRHKTLILPPSYHAEPHDPDASRHDWRPFLLPGWDRQFRQIDQLVKFAEQTKEQPTMPGVPARIHSYMHGVSTTSK
eukprot:Blabericola_migrator_1__5717@NODE_28_length_19984_cov_212_654667_g25_i0_p2_GENE_NODE_28_length_19984_cov_212_654667_g25_i0NODE_28_length_19984_cov_212_654667_g25_i0_p2_ORF_typecomplete_len841_score123_10NAD_synthase/PF02540_17/6e53CN_hydrolase/PF00795_22/5_1e30CN_hydrolase/PF00795_22/1_7e03Asn_synthase/PF00733_21/0_11_NODE_28_length_19984_cov_212_654667_g25_i067919313